MNTKTLLAILLGLLGLGGLGGAISMFIDPSGQSIGLPAGLLDSVPFIDTFLLPGIFLFVVMGIAPLIIAWGLWRRTPWSWPAAVAQSVVLILWIGFQIVLWGAPAAIQWLYLVWGVVMLGLCFAPGVRPIGRGSSHDLP